MDSYEDILQCVRDAALEATRQTVDFTPVRQLVLTPDISFCGQPEKLIADSITLPAAILYIQTRPEIADVPMLSLKDPGTLEQAARLLAQIEKLSVLSPGFQFMERLIGYRDEECAMVKLTLGALLREKTVELVDPRDGKAGTGALQERYSDLLRRGAELGCQLVRPGQTQMDEVPRYPQLLLETDVAAEERAGRRVILVGGKCIITPLAYDLASTCKIKIERAR